MAVRAALQLSVPVSGPQFLPNRIQKAASVSGMQAHTFVGEQICGCVHVPQLATMREVPQLSAAVRAPQFLLWRMQKAVLVSGAQLQTLGAPPTGPQVAGVVQVPQLATVRARPQTSVPDTAPQFFPTRAQKSGSFSPVQPQTFAVPPPAQLFTPLQLPQEAMSRVWPQRSVTPVREPQVFPSELHSAASVSGAQTQAFALQLLGKVQVPHDVTVLGAPQLSVAVTAPQALPRRVQNAALLSGTQLGWPQMLATPLPAQVLGWVQLPQATVRSVPQRSVKLALPQLKPRD